MISGAVTVIELVPVFPPLVAVIDTGPPAPTPVTSPFASTVAAALFEVHVMARPVRTLLLASLTVATNCCAALRACSNAGWVLVGSLLNMGALVSLLKADEPEDLLLVCAGTVREPALEDLFAAGMLCSQFPEAACSDAARITASVFRKYQEDPIHCLHESRKGRTLMADSQREDIRWCAHRSLYAVVAEMRDGVIRKV